MGLTRYKIGEFVSIYNVKCGIPDLTENDVSGVNRDKELFAPSNQIGSNTSNYKVVPPGYFACNLMHVGRDKVLPIAMNHSGVNCIVSPAYTIFSFDGKGALLPDYFFIYLKSEERDRYFWFHTDASVRDGMSWDDFCDLEIQVPSIEIQQKYVDIYNAMVANQKCYEDSLEDLKLACDAELDRLLKEEPREGIGPYIVRHDERNRDNSIKNVKGVSTTKEFRDPTAKVDVNKLHNYKIVHPRQISFVQTTNNEKVLSSALNLTNEDIVVTSVNEVFSTDESRLLPEYLELFLLREEFDRYARFHSWGSARETFTWMDMQEVEIPIPKLEVQHALADMFTSYNQRKEINKRLKAQIKDICPILIKGSLEEASKS